MKPNRLIPTQPLHEEAEGQLPSVNMVTQNLERVSWKRRARPSTVFCFYHGSGNRKLAIALSKKLRNGLRLHQLAGLVQVVVDDRFGIDSKGVVNGSKQLRGMDRLVDR